MVALAAMENLLVERSGSGVVTVTMSQPERKNAINMPMWDGMLAVFREVEERSEDRVIVLTGAGDVFSAGADLGGEPDGRHQLALMKHFNDVGMALHNLSVPTLARVNGLAVGAALNLALSCDLVVAADTARFAEIFIKRGLSLDLGGSWLLPRLVGMHRAKELALFGDMIDAAEAERIGLVNRVVPADELDAATAEWAERLAQGPPLAQAMTKRMLNNAFSVSLAEALDAEAMAQSVNVASEDTREAIKAFFEKREPVFTGR